MFAKTLSTSRRYGRLHEVAGKRAEFCQALYPLLVAHADDFGRLPGDVFTVKHAVVPTSPRKEHDITAALAALHLVGLIHWYEVGDAKCIQIENFEEHQQGLHKRSKSRFPEPQGNSGKVREIPSEQNRTEEKGTEENTLIALNERFERFWSEYPRKVGKDAARRVWLHRAPADDLTDLIIAKVREHRASAQWLKDGGQFIPHPRTWLHGKRWEDETTPALSRAAMPVYTEWHCPHVEHCEDRGRCRNASILGRPERQTA
jgi:hypothetical protein